MRIGIAGGGGTVGGRVVEAARRRGHEAVILTRGAGVDVRDPAAVRGALDGVDAVVDVLNINTLNTRRATEFFAATTAALLEAGRAAGVGHHIALSIVGVDRAPYGYYAAKLAQERLVEGGGVPWSIQRATQFHDFARQMYDGARLGPLHLAPRGRVQPVDVQEVADRLVEVVESGPQGRVTDLAGPREESLVCMVRDYARAQGVRGWIPEVSLPGGLGRAQQDGSLLPGRDAILGRRTFEAWLGEFGQH